MLQYPFVKKLAKTNTLLIERILPSDGEIYVKTGDIVEPFTKVGFSKTSIFSQKLDNDVITAKNFDTYIEKGVAIGQKKKGNFKTTKIYAPYNGFLRRKPSGIFFEQEDLDFTLLSGAWGKVSNIVEKKAVLLQVSANVLYCAVSTPFDAEGELIVLPNPTELIEDPYFNNFTKDIAGKIIYSGHFIKLSNLKKARDLGVRGIFAGGFDKETYEFALENKFFIGSISGFGRIPTPDPIFNFLNSVTSRYIFAKGQKGEIFIPSEKQFTEEELGKSKDFFTELKNGMIVQILERPYFGWIGTVESQVDDKVLVKVINGLEVVNVRATNLLVPVF